MITLRVDDEAILLTLVSRTTWDLITAGDAREVLIGRYAGGC